MRFLTVLSAILVTAVWGLNSSVGKMAVGDLPPFALLSLRFLLIFIFFAPFSKITKADTLKLFGIAFMANVVSNGLCYTAFFYLQPTASILLLQTESIVTMIMAFLICGETISRRQAAGVLTAAAGTLVVFGMPELNLFGALLIMLSRFSWGLTQIWYKDIKQTDGCTFIAYSSIFAVPFTVLISLLTETKELRPAIEQIEWDSFSLIMFFQVFALSGAMILWQKMIARQGVNKITPYSVLQVVFGILGGVVFFNDSITWNVWAGSMLICTGVLIATFPKKEKTI